MAKDHYQELESPFLDEEVLPPPTAGEESSRVEDFTIPEVEEAGTSGAEVDEPEVDEEYSGESEYTDSEERESEDAYSASEDNFTGEESDLGESESDFNAEWAFESPFLDEHAEQSERELEPEAESEAEDEFVEREDKDTAKSVNVIVDQPGESDDKYQLVSTDGKFSKTLGVAQAKPLVTGEKVLIFPGVDPKKKYRLIHIRSAGSKRVVLPDIPFQFLTAAGKGPQTAKHTYVTLPSQVTSKLPDKNGIERDVDPILVAASPQLLDLVVEDPKL